MNIMDYSMLVGLHSLVRGNSDHLFDRNLAVIEPNESGFSQRPILSESEPVSSFGFNPRERSMSCFYCEGGGLRASYQDDSPADEIYYLGIIDILTPYGKTKRIESFFKSIRYRWEEISAINPMDYAKRFVRFMSENILQNTEFDYTIKPLPNVPVPEEGVVDHGHVELIGDP
jgi:1-phosphatidylinositol-4-phosphate 5-kinase